MGKALDLWRSYWTPFAKAEPTGMSLPLRAYWRRRAESGEIPTLQLPDFDPTAIAAAHGTRRKAEDPTSVWNEEGYLPPDPEARKKAPKERL